MQEIVLREETIKCINKYINETFVYVLGADLHGGCIKHMCNKDHRDLCVRERSV